jgi:hypothetical protein
MSVNALNFDFDHAPCHLDRKVSVETLKAKFKIIESGLDRIAALVHYLNIGGIYLNEACGFAGLSCVKPSPMTVIYWRLWVH